MLKRKLVFILAAFVSIILWVLIHLSVPDMRNRLYATSPAALLNKAKLGKLDYEVSSVSIDTADHSPLGDHVQITYHIRFLDTLSFSRRVSTKWKDPAWWSRDYMQHIRVIGNGLIEAKACYDVDTSSHYE